MARITSVRKMGRSVFAVKGDSAKELGERRSHTAAGGSPQTEVSSSG